MYGLAKQFGGSIQIESQLGKGTVIHFYLPRANNDAASAEDAASSEGVESGGKVQLILIVDDDPDVRNLVSDFIDMLGYRTMTADSGRSALEILIRHNDIALLVSDVVMPGMNGFQLSEQVRKTRPELPILLMSGYADYAKLNSGSLGVALIEKPFRLDDIEPVLGRLLQERPR